MATIKEIADKLGVSIGTVSKGLNGAHDISEELRQAVLNTAVELGYTPKHQKREGMRKLIMFVPDSSYRSEGSPFYHLAMAFQRSALSEHWNAEVVELTDDLQSINYEAFLMEKRCIGTFFAQISESDAWFRQICEENLSTVLLQFSSPETAITSLTRIVLDASFTSFSQLSATQCQTLGQCAFATTAAIASELPLRQIQISLSEK